MKLTKKKVLLASLAVCLVAIISFGTLAWFTAEDTVVNEFYVGDSTTDPDDVFGIDVWETVDANGDGAIDSTEILGKDTADTTGAKYETILPGQAFDKDPYLTNTGIHPQYVRAIVTITEADILKVAMTPKGATLSEWFDIPKFLPGTGDKWSLEYKYYTNKDTFVLVYYYTEVLEPGTDTQKLFDDVVIPTELTKEQAAEMENFTITILGQAIQSEHLADVTTAKEVFAKYWDEEGYVAGVNIENDLASDTVSISYPVTGNLGTVKNDLIVYDPANYTDPEAPGALVMSDVKATVKTGADLIVIPAEQNNVTILMIGAEYTVEDGASLVSCPHTTGAVYVRNVTINGEKITYANADEMSTKYFSGLGLYFA